MEICSYSIHLILKIEEMISSSFKCDAKTSLKGPQMTSGDICPHFRVYARW